MQGRTVVGGITSVLAAVAVLCVPGFSIGAPLTDSGGGSERSLTVQPSEPSAPVLRGAGAQPARAVPGTTPYLPPLHGTNPHGQGTVGTIDLAPSGQRPLAGDPDGGDAPNQEEIVVGRARGEQRADGTYHGHITVLALFGNEVIGVDTNQGETKNSPLQPIQDVLDALCPGGVGPICLTVLRADSATTSNSSTNAFEAANLRVGSGTSSLTAQVAASNGTISSDGTCQTAHGDSRVAALTIGSGATTTPQIDAVTSSSDSQACRGQAPTQTNTSDVIDPDVGVGPILPAACGSGGPNNSGTPNTAGGIAVLLPLVCNADDSNSTQTSAPYGVREALSVFALVTPATDTALAKITAGASESRAVAPVAAQGPGPGPGAGPGAGAGAGGGGAGDDDDDDGGGEAGDRAGEGAGPDDGADAGDRGAGAGPAPGDGAADALAFTGVDLLYIGLAGALMLAAGLGLRRLAAGGKRVV